MAGERASELRQDIVSGEWVVIATGRARRPSDFVESTEASKEKGVCPFDRLGTDAKMVVAKDGVIHRANLTAVEWFVAVIPNKYPAFSPTDFCPMPQPYGPHAHMEGAGIHEVIYFKPHARSIAEMTTEETRLVALAYRDRYRILPGEPCVQYVSLIHNHGAKSGASILHPHSQILAIPVMPPRVSRSFMGSARYFKEHQRCVHCVIIETELKEKARLVFENEHFLAFAPYASRAAFELRIFPKKHESQFAELPDASLTDFAEALRVVLQKLSVGLNNPSYNFFIHTAPAKAVGSFEHYHWHLEILPKTSIWGGLEFGTGIEISTIAPENAAAFLRSVSSSIPIESAI
jgi:UDPglucose--hexose-1-phosphate uridylyltransferase